MKIPNLILTHLYIHGSLENLSSGVRFELKNRLSDFTIMSVARIAIDDVNAPLQEVVLEWNSGDGGGEKSGGLFTWLFGGGSARSSEPVRVMATDINPQKPLHMPLRRHLRIELPTIAPLQHGKHKISLVLLAEPIGEIEFTVKDSIKIVERRTP